MESRGQLGQREAAEDREWTSCRREPGDLNLSTGAACTVPQAAAGQREGTTGTRQGAPRRVEGVKERGSHKRHFEEPYDS